MTMPGWSPDDPNRVIEGQVVNSHHDTLGDTVNGAIRIAVFAWVIHTLRQSHVGRIILWCAGLYVAYLVGSFLVYWVWLLITAPN